MKKETIIVPKGYESNGDIWLDVEKDELVIPVRKKTPILITHDGVELFVGDPFWEVVEQDGKRKFNKWGENDGRSGKKFIVSESTFKYHENYFSTKKSAKAFINEKIEFVKITKIDPESTFFLTEGKIYKVLSFYHSSPRIKDDQGDDLTISCSKWERATQEDFDKQGFELPVSVDELIDREHYFIRNNYELLKLKSNFGGRGAFHTKKRAEQMAALDKLIKLYDEWCLLLNYTPDWDDYNERKYVINRNLHVVNYYDIEYIIAFPDENAANKFLETFKSDLELIQDFL